MDNILVFAGSNAKDSINQWFANELGKQDGVDYLDIRKLDLPMFNSDIQETTGIPNDVKMFYDKIRSYKKIILVSPEYNGYTPAYLKSLLDWLSVIERFYFDSINLCIVAVTPGQKGGASVREMLSKMLSFTKVIEVGNIGIPHFKAENDYSKEFEQILNVFK